MNIQFYAEISSVKKNSTGNGIEDEGNSEIATKNDKLVFKTRFDSEPTLSPVCSSTSLLSPIDKCWNTEI